MQKNDSITSFGRGVFSLDANLCFLSLKIKKNVHAVWVDVIFHDSPENYHIPRKLMVGR